MGLAPLKKDYFTVEEYLERERKSFERHIYLDGEIFEMAGESTAHGHICVNLVREISSQLKGRPCSTFTKDTKVRSGSDLDLHRWLKGFFSYPDVVVVCGDLQYHDKYKDILLNPTVIIEVLSETTEAFDRGEKFRRFRTHLPTLTDYVLVSQDRPFIDHYRRGNNHEWILSSLSDLDESLNLYGLDCRIPLREIYDRVEFPEFEYPASEEETPS
jgi:Uma2 family endonuclease